MNFLKKHPTRRQVAIGGMAAGAGLVTLGTNTSGADDGELETKRIRLIRDRAFPVLCYAPQYVAQRFLELEGFTDIQYVSLGEDGSYANALIEGTADMSAALGVDWVPPIAEGKPIKVLSGLHAGCVEIFGNDAVETVQDLKGKRIAVHGLGSPERFLLSSVLAYIGIQDAEVEWVFAHPNEWTPMLVEGKVDALASFPPLNYYLHDEGIGHVVLNTTTDKPWKHMFCCMVATNSTFAAENPVAAKRALRAIMKANQLCTDQPEMAAKWLVEEGQSPTIDYAMRTLRDLPYDTWDTYDPEDTLRFYALRLQEAGIIEATPETIIADGTDWGPLNALLKELKT